MRAADDDDHRIVLSARRPDVASTDTATPGLVPDRDAGGHGAPAARLV